MTKQQKLTLANHARQLLAAGGMRQADVARQLGLTPVQLTRFLRLDADSLARPAAGGRPASVPLTPGDIDLLRRYRLMNKVHSLAKAIDAFLDDPSASPEAYRALSAIIARAHAERRQPKWPLSVRKAAELTPALEAELRGSKHAFDVAMRSRSGAFIRIGDRDVPLRAGMVFQSDDMSINQPYRYFDAALGRETTGRQTLITRDTRSLRWLQADLCGRERDAYRLEDIADHMRAVVEANGLPLAWIVERGPWKNTFIDGLRLEDGRRWGSLSDLFFIHHAFTSTGKSEVEGGFAELQSLLSHRSTDIGAHRGEFEKATKLFLRAQKGHADALPYFWALPECAAALVDVMERDNRALKSRQHFNGRTVSAEELWAAEHVRTPLLEKDRWYFLPVKKTASVRGGIIEVRADHYERSFRFAVHGAVGMPLLPNLYPVLIAFHPARPHEGCHVFNACTDQRNREGFAFGQLIGVAEFDADVPKYVFDGAAPEIETKRKRNAALRAEYRTIMPAGEGPAMLKSVARDGLGNALEVQRNPTADAPAPAEPARETRIAAPVRGGLAAMPREAAALFGSDRAAALAALESAAEQHL